MIDDPESGSHRSPVTEMMGLGYQPAWSEGALKPPIFQTSTFVFSSAAEGKRFFEVAYGLREARAGEGAGLIYSRINNPGIEILEDRLRAWEAGDAAVTFASGMAAITTTMLAHLRPGTTLAHSAPLYGGTDHVIAEVLPEFGVTPVAIEASASADDVVAALAGRSVAMIYLETPANPTNVLHDIAQARQVAERVAVDGARPPVVVDNTFLGPLWQRPLDHGADVSIYSATKYLGGHSDLIAGAAVGRLDALAPVAAMRTFLGTMLDPWTAWLLLRSLETLDLRVRRATENATVLASRLAEHPKVLSVRSLALLRDDDAQHQLYQRQCTGPGAVVGVEVADGEAGAFRFLDALRVIHLAVSLGGTESLAEHPATMTHAGVAPARRLAHGVTPGLVRLSFGIEDVEDLWRDVDRALSEV